MSQVPIWFERKFEFSFPEELLPNLCARLRGTPARLEEVLRGRPHDILIWKSQGKWSPQEHAGHLLDLEPLWLARVSNVTRGTLTYTSIRLSLGRGTIESRTVLLEIRCPYLTSRSADLSF